MAWSAGREAAEEAAAPYRWETRVRSLLKWRRRVGLWRSGHECQAPLAASTKLAVDVETERCCTVMGAGGSSCPWPQCTWPCGGCRPRGLRRGRRARTACPGSSGQGPLGREPPSQTGAVRVAAAAGDRREAGPRAEERWGGRGRGPRGLRGGRPPAGERGGRQR